MGRLLVTTVSVLLWTLTVMAQNAIDFKQPYPLGEQLPTNSNFTGKVWLAPIIDKFLKEHLFADIFERV